MSSVAILESCPTLLLDVIKAILKPVQIDRPAIGSNANTNLISATVPVWILSRE